MFINSRHGGCGTANDGYWNLHKVVEPRKPHAFDGIGRIALAGIEQALQSEERGNARTIPVNQRSLHERQDAYHLQYACHEKY